MRDLSKHEQFEIEVLEKLYNERILNNLVFVGGTMLRLCYGLDRYSVDLDFWIIKEIDVNDLFRKISNTLRKFYFIKDEYNKHSSLIFEFTSKNYPNAIKIEIRKEFKKINIEKNIAYTPNSNIQILLNTISLKDMMDLKIKTFLIREEIRDVYDIEFIYKKGIKPEIDKETALLLVEKINKLTKNDYKVKLGLLIESNKRKYYNTSNFKILKSYLEKIINS